MKLPRLKAYLLGAAMAGAILILDIVTKRMAQTRLASGPKTIIDGVFELFLTTNTGASFSIFEGGRWFFVALTPIILAAIVFLYIKSPLMRRSAVACLSMAMVFGGALGNFIDRLTVGHVVDFFRISAINFPVFNVADIFIVCGAVLLIIVSLFGRKAVSNV